MVLMATSFNRTTFDSLALHNIFRYKQFYNHRVLMATSFNVTVIPPVDIYYTVNVSGMATTEVAHDVM